MKSKFLASAALAAAASLAMVGCSSTATPAATGDSTATATATASGPITVGFVAVGPEGGWRTANENKIKESFSTANGFELKYAPSNNGDQSSQITAFNSFIDHGVDAILLSATEATGCETVPIPADDIDRLFDRYQNVYGQH